MKNTARRASPGAAVTTPLPDPPATQTGGTPASDFLIISAFTRREEAYAAYNALPYHNGPVVNGYGPHERELWAIIDEAEDIIRSNLATTPRGALCQLWCALYHSVSGQEADEALQRGDFDAVEHLPDDRMDWSARLTLAAARSLRAMLGGLA